MSEQEKAIVNNIARKLETILYREKITVLGLSKILKIDKQPLYRIIKREHIPNILFLEMIANYLQCTVIELMDERNFLDIKVYPDYSIKSQAQSKYNEYRTYSCDEKFIKIAEHEFFGIKENSCIKVFYKVNKIESDGCYLLQENNHILKEITILSAGSSLVIALINKQEVRLNPEQISVVAKLYKTVSIIKFDGCAIKH